MAEEKKLLIRKELDQRGRGVERRKQEKKSFRKKAEHKQKKKNEKNEKNLMIIMDQNKIIYLQHIFNHARLLLLPLP